MNQDFDSIRPGDIVRVTRYMIGRLCTPVHDTGVEGQEAIVLSMSKRLLSERYYAIDARVLASGRRVCLERYDDHSTFELVSKGSGTVVPGIDYSLTDDELRDQRWRAFCARVKAHDYRHEGFVNAATYLACLYLTNDAIFVRAMLPAMRRKDGTVNAEKTRKAFFNRGLKVDDWAYECPIDVPAEFHHHHIPGLPRVCWQEVADNLKAGV